MRRSTFWRLPTSWDENRRHRASATCMLWGAVKWEFLTKLTLYYVFRKRYSCMFGNRSIIPSFCFHTPFTYILFIYLYFPPPSLAFTPLAFPRYHRVSPSDDGEIETPQMCSYSVKCMLWSHRTNDIHFLQNSPSIEIMARCYTTLVAMETTKNTYRAI